MNDPVLFRERIEDLEKANFNLRRAYHNVSAHNQFFERCEDPYCQPNPTLSCAFSTRSDTDMTPGDRAKVERIQDLERDLTEARRLAVSEEDQQAVRMYLWLNHGHHMMYGDDGEMQCVECMPFGLIDYKREPFSKVIKISEEVRMQSNLIKWNEKNIYQGGPDGPMEGM